MSILVKTTLANDLLEALEDERRTSQPHCVGVIAVVIYADRREIEIEASGAVRRLPAECSQRQRGAVRKFSVAMQAFVKQQIEALRESGLVIIERVNAGGDRERD